MTEFVLAVGLPVAAALMIGAVVSRLLANWARRRGHKQTPLVHADPYFTQGGRLPEFLSGHNWPVNPNRRSHR